LALAVIDNIVEFVALSSNGKYVVPEGDDKTARVWKWHVDDIIRKACSLVTHNLTLDNWTHYLSDESYQVICPKLPIELNLSASPMPWNSFKLI
jgi:WD40 repeat protein